MEGDATALAQHPETWATATEVKALAHLEEIAAAATRLELRPLASELCSLRAVTPVSGLDAELAQIRRRVKWCATIEPPSKSDRRFQMTNRTRLRTERISRGWTQGDLAEMLSRDTSVVSQWERGIVGAPHPRTRVKLEAIFGLPIADLFAMSDDDRLPDAAPKS